MATDKGADRAWRAFDDLVLSLKNRYLHSREGLRRVHGSSTPSTAAECDRMVIEASARVEGNATKGSLGGRTDSERIPPRIVFVLGAGASIWSGLPLWKDIKSDIRAIINESFSGGGASGDNVFVEEAWRLLAPSIGHVDPTWDSQQKMHELFERATNDELCAVACKYETVREKIRHKLEAVFNNFVEADDRERNAEHADGRKLAPPQLAYELIAHLLRHRYIDHVISFDFDEVLDTCLENELHGHYALITSEYQMSPKIRAEHEPRVFKLHGTTSNHGSMRFAAGEAGVLPYRMVQLLDATLLGIVGGERAPQEPKLHLVSLGYSWADKGLARWLHDRITYIDRVTLIGLETKIPRLLKSDPYNVHLLPLGSIEITNGQKPSLSVDELLWAAWNQVKDELASGDDRRAEGQGEPFIPAARHIILGTIFGPADRLVHGKHRAPPLLQAPRSFFRTPHTRERRFFIESLLHVAKCRGMVNASVMAAHHRIHRYQPEQKNNTRPMDSLAQCGLLRPSKYADVEETYYWPEKDLSHLVGLVFEHVLRCPRDRKLQEPTIERRSSSGVRGIRLQDTDFDTFLRRQLAEIMKAPEIEVASPLGRRRKWLFRNSQQLDSYLQLASATKSLIERPWTHLMAIAESGEWLTSAPFVEHLKQAARTMPERKVLIITARPDLSQWAFMKEIARNMSEQWREITIAYFEGDLSWWQHNRHLTLALDMTSSGAPFVGGIYFRRELKASQIAPVEVSEQEDCAELLKTFLVYLRRACSELTHEDIVRQIRPTYDKRREKNLRLAREAIELTGQIVSSGSRADRLWEPLKRCLREAGNAMELLRRYRPEEPILDASGRAGTVE